MGKLRVAAVGLGWVCLNRHLPVMDRLDDYSVTGVIDRRPGRAELVAKQRKYRRYATAEQLADVQWLDEVDAVTIATPPMAHAALIGEALALNKHVLTEKPFTMTVQEGRKLAAEAANSNLCLAIVHNFQFARSTKDLLNDITAGKLGRLTAINAIQLGNPRRRLPHWYNELPFGLFYDESPHLLYLLRCLAGDIEPRRVLIIRHPDGFNTPSQIDAFFNCSGGIPATLRCNFDSPISEWYVMAFGERALGVIDIFRDIYILLPNDGIHNSASVLRTSLSATVQHWWQHLTSGIPHLTGSLFYGNEDIFRRFAAAIHGDAKALAPIDSANALAVLELQHKIIDCAQDAI